MVEIIPPTTQIRVKSSDTFRPMLSASIPSSKNRVPTTDEILNDLRKLNWNRGFFCSPKIDGIRAIKHPDKGLLSRSLKPIPNRFIQECLSSPVFNLLDGELVIGSIRDQDFVNFNDSQSGIMTAAGSPFFTYCVFDHIEKPFDNFVNRTFGAQLIVETIRESVNFQGMFDILWVNQKLVHSPEELLDYEAETVEKGYEGIIVRDPWGVYKNNRSTFREQGMIKIKRFVDAEAVIEGFEELYINTNPAEIDKLGYQKRSSHLSNQMPAGMLGKLLVRAINGRFGNETFFIGSGFDDSLRRKIWNNREEYLGRIVKFKYQDAGAKNKPRSPIFLGFRDGGE